MTGRRIAPLVALLLFTLAGGAAQAADLGARAMGMGGAYTALANDATAVYWNPAGLAEVSWVSLTPVVALETSGYEAFTDFVELLRVDLSDPLNPPEMPTEDWDISVSSTGLAGIATKRFGLSYLPSAKASVGYTYVPGNYGLDSVLYGDAVVYNDKVFTAAIPLSRAPFNLAQLNIGANLKFIDGRYYKIEKSAWDIASEELSEAEEADDPAARLGATGSGFGLDLGAQAQVTERLRLGFVARDLVRNVTWTGAEKPDEESRPTIQAGAAFKAPLGLTLAADVENTRENGKDVTRLRAGGELSAFGLVAVRGGVRTNPDGAKPTYSLGLGAGIFKFLRLEGAIAGDLEDRLEFCLTGVAQF